MPELTVPIRRRGALVRVLVRARPDRASAAPAAARAVAAYLDTGASDTMLDAALVRSLGLRAARSAALSVLGRDGVSYHDAHPVELALEVPAGIVRWVAVDALAGPVYATGAPAALGRDFLAHFLLSYDGPGRLATLRW